VAYARDRKDETPFSAAIYGGVAGGLTDEADELIRGVMADLLDRQARIPS
jgi:sphinganine-1-phosphate aldolase